MMSTPDGFLSTLVMWEEIDGIATVRLNRPEAANALSKSLLEQLQTILNSIMHRNDIRVVILTALGEKAFCAGADLKERRGMADVEVRQAVARIHQTIELVAHLPMPVIAAVNGVAFGGGVEIALAADLRIAAQHAKLGLTETGLAIIPGAGGTQRLPRLIGVAKAKELIYTARHVSAREALELGLVNQVVPAEELANAANQLAKSIAKNGPIAVRQAKYAIDVGYDLSLTAGLEVEKKAYELIVPTKDRLEGLVAFGEKRPPVYRGE